MKTKIYLLGLFSFITVNLFSQIKISQNLFEQFKTLPKEQIFVHFNSNLLICGENLLFKIYNLHKEDKTLSNLSKIAYLELIDSNKKTIIKKKISLNKGEGFGDIFIPSEIESGNYKLIAYTKWMKNFNSYFNDDIFIINPFQEKITFNHSSIEDKKPIVYDYTHNTREIVTLYLDQIIKTQGNYSISVKKENYGILNLKSSPLNFSNEKKDFFLKNEDKIFIPEFRGQLIVGKLHSPSNKKIKNIRVGLSIIENDKIFKISSTNKDGYFIFNIASPFLSKNVYVKTLENNEDYKISFPIEETLNLLELDFFPIKTTSRLIETINKRSVYTQIQNAYNEVIKDSIKKISTDSSIFKDKIIQYNLDSYTRFNTMKETFVEIINDAWVAKKNGKNRFYVRNNSTTTNTNIQPLIIIDGYIITDHEELLDINPRTIQTISLLTEKYKLNSKIYEGVIVLKSKKNNYTPKKQKSLVNYSIKTISPQKKYFYQKYLSNNNKSRIPDYRTQLFWNPKISFSEKITFYTSDVKGDFSIEIQGFTNKGEPIHITKYLHVK